MTKTKSQRARAKQAKKGRSLPSKKNRSPKGKRVRKAQKKSKMKGPGPDYIKAGTGRLGLSMSSGSNVTNRRQKVCEEDEFIANVTGSSSTTAFTISNSLQVNPGQSTCFPWLALEAAQYNEYQFEKLEFYYKRTVSEYATAGTQGKVLLFFNPDASDAAPTTKQQIEDAVYHNDGMPCDPVIRLVVDCNRLNKNDAKFVRVGAQPANTDIKTYDIGTLVCATDSTANANTVGELRVRYRVKFTVPILLPSAQAGGAMHFSSIAATTANNFAGAVLQSGSTPSMSGITLGTNTINFPANIPGNYLVTLAVAGGTSASVNGLNSIGGGTPLNLMTQSGVRDAIAPTSSLAGTTTAAAMSIFAFGILQTGNTITINPSTIVGTGSMDLFIFSLPTTVLTVDEIEQLEIDELRAQVKRQGKMLNDIISKLNNNVVELGPSESEEEAATSDLVKLPLKKTRKFGVLVGPGNPSLASRIDVDECKEQSSASSKSWFGAK